MALEVQGFAPMVSVFDMPRSLAFYRDVLGFEVVSTSEPRRGDDFYVICLQWPASNVT
jgi:glyoxylase I family protein